MGKKKKIPTNEELGKRLRTFAAKLERDISETKKRITEFEAIRDAPREPEIRDSDHEMKNFDHVKYAASQSIQYLTGESMRYREIADEFYQHFPELKHRRR